MPCFDALRNNGDSKLLRHTDDARDDDALAFGIKFQREETLIELDYIDRQGAQEIERGISGAEIVDRDTEAGFPQFVHSPDDQFVVVHESALGEPISNKSVEMPYFRTMPFRFWIKLSSYILRREKLTETGIAGYPCSIQRWRAAQASSNTYRSSFGDKPVAFKYGYERARTHKAFLRRFPAHKRLRCNWFCVLRSNLG